MHALAICEAEDQRPRLLFEAFGPAVRLAVAAGVPLDSARDVLIAALLDAARARWPALAERALAMGRTTRAIRGLEKRPDPAESRRGVNVLKRAEALLDTPRTRSQLACDLPVFDGFDSGRVALAALLRTGRATPIAARRGEPTRYQRTTPEPVAPTDAAARVDVATAHLESVGDAELAEATHHETRRVEPDAHAQALADIEAFITRRIAQMSARAAGRSDAVTATAHLGAVER